MVLVGRTAACRGAQLPALLHGHSSAVSTGLKQQSLVWNAATIEWLSHFSRHSEASAELSVPVHHSQVPHVHGSTSHMLFCVSLHAHQLRFKAVEVDEYRKAQALIQFTCRSRALLPLWTCMCDKARVLLWPGLPSHRDAGLHWPCSIPAHRLLGGAPQKSCSNPCSGEK